MKSGTGTEHAHSRKVDNSSKPFGMEEFRGLYIHVDEIDSGIYQIS